MIVGQSLEVIADIGFPPAGENSLGISLPILPNPGHAIGRGAPCQLTLRCYIDDRHCDLPL